MMRFDNKLTQKLTQSDNIYFFKMLRFLKPYAIPYVLTQFIYSSQGFVFQFILALFSSNIMAGVLATDGGMLGRIAIITAIATLCYVIILGLGTYFNMIIVEKTILDIKRKLFRAFMKTGIEDAGHSGGGIAAINTDANTAKQLLTSPLFALTQSIVIIAGASITIFVIDWRLGLAAIAVGVFSFSLQLRFSVPLAQIGKKRLDANASSIKEVSSIFSGAITIRSYNMQKQALISFDHVNKELKALGFKQGLIRTWQNLFRTIEGWLDLFVTFGLGGWLVITGRIEFHLLIAVFVMISALTSAIGGLGEVYANLRAPLAGAKRIFAIMENVDKNSKYRQCNMEKSGGYKISIKDFNFRYANGEDDVIKNINLTIDENQMVVILGESGSGKSTLLRALVGMYQRENLQVTLGNLDFQSTSLENWRKHFAYVDQNYKLFDMSIKDNIAMGIGGEATDESIILAAKQAAAHDFIEKLEEGYNFHCGERGDFLSGGQKQRIAIARALIRKAPILVFDEITSALDEENERQIMNILENLRKEHTIILASHSLKSISTADKILVMENGRIVESGTHMELIAKGEVYCRLLNKY